MDMVVSYIHIYKLIRMIHIRPLGTLSVFLYHLDSPKPTCGATTNVTVWYRADTVNEIGTLIFTDHKSGGAETLGSVCHSVRGGVWQDSHH